MQNFDLTYQVKTCYYEQNVVVVTEGILLILNVVMLNFRHYYTC